MAVSAIAWSPDGRYIALNDLNLRPMPGIRLLTPKGEQVGSVDRSIYGCTLDPGASLVFSTSLSIWAACVQMPGRSADIPCLLAVQLSIPDLKLLNVVPGDAESTGLRGSSYRQYLNITGGRQILTSVLQSPIKYDFSPSGRATLRYPRLYRIRMVGLDSMQVEIPVLSFKGEMEHPRRLHKVVYFPEIRAIVIHWTLEYGAWFPQENPETWSKAQLVPSLESYSLANGERMAGWASLADEDAGYVIRLKDQPLLVGTFGPGGGGRGGLRVWDPRTGQGLQRLDGSRGRTLELSNDGRRLAVFHGDRVMFYRVAKWE
jgi:hypothetical protein